MKKTILLFIMILTGSLVLYSQVPQAMTYKAIAKDDWGVALTSKAITLRFTILQGSEFGSPVYIEVHSTVTNKFGLMDVQIGKGIPTLGNFAGIDWSTGIYFIKIEMDPKGGSDFRLEDPAHQLLSVPYALYAGSAANGFSGYYSDLIGAPDLSIVATSGNYNHLMGKPILFSGDYNDLTNKPSLFSGNYNDLTNKPNLFDGTWGSLTGKPSFSAVAFSGSWNDLIDKPSLFDGTWVSLSGKPAFAAVATSGSFADLSNIPTTIAGFGITDAMSTSHPTNGIIGTDITNWNAAFSWGNHAGLYKPLSYVPVWAEVIGNPFNITSPAADQILKYNAVSSQWENWTPNYLTTEVDGSVTNEIQDLILTADILKITNNPTATEIDLAHYKADGSETIVIGGINSTVTGSGVSSDPYIINSTGTGTTIPGNNPGDMQYWNGTGWVVVQVGQPGQFLQLTNSGIPAWSGSAYPALTTTAASSIAGTTATSGGNITSDGGAAITVRGVCWSTTTGPTTALSTKTTDGTGTGVFTSSLTGLTANTTYYVRAYATNSIGTAYGTQVSFTTSSGGQPGTVTDVEGNIYNTVTIGTQTWMAGNLKTTRYNDGTAIPNITVDAAWAALTTGAYSDYYNTPGISPYGRLYNWYAVDNNAATKVASNGGKNVCPTSWHVPTDTEWTTLTTYLGGVSVAGGKLKETGTTHWQSPNMGATNETGFTALPGSYRYGNGTFYYGIGVDGDWWSSTEGSSTLAWGRSMYCDYARVGRAVDCGKQFGFSVRCVRDF